jgi:hypothetical protein
MSSSFVNESVCNKVPQQSRITITYKPGETRDKDEYMVKTEGNFGGVATIGTLAAVQAWLLAGGNRTTAYNDYTADQLCITFGDPPMSGHDDWSADPRVPVVGLVGTLEVLKQSLVGNSMMGMAQQARQQTMSGLIDPRGRPLRRK